ncbi:RcpC/CpaB family pilus assembly protein [Streptomyces taklimakanensis]|uniref:RcpC/CpaB family pilus assembly protein n=1 Tax=Streptomyces taklimakanensis TaxID=2569853 RepID=UPI00308467E8
MRVPDAAVVRLLRPGDRVDVLAVPAGSPPGGGSVAGAPSGPSPAPARTVARGVRVAAVPDPLPASVPEHGGPEGSAEPTGEAGALVVLSVTRSTAARILSAAAHSRLAVTLC